MKQGFDNNEYLKIQSDQIRKRIDSFGGKLYLEFGGKLLMIFTRAAFCRDSAGFQAADAAGIKG